MNKKDIQVLFNTSLTATVPPPASPIMLDLDGDGIETVGVAGQDAVFFDLDGDGIKNLMGWAGSDAFFEQNKFYRQFTDRIEIPEELFGLPIHFGIWFDSSLGAQKFG